ncbi:bifunctional 2-C-methyl-D-erythritol 4-phosphate cytidylyltransferase/2-C-methyl-D-erythritol 2,4-cyclodiphosphate synthase [bacterium BFN5]|nr:bifunctional 2-C-methyl-D-erythritol 4-phosphate cytidylyltransferase/2-C-methyl-D-erythritol 2,4-cyclodiphosphate synthase [bacterium BFN5]
MVSVIIAAAGQGKRMGAPVNKVFLPLADQPVLLHSIAAFSACSQVDDLVVVVAAEEVDQVKSMMNHFSCRKPYQIVAGGSERQYSIANALAVLSSSTDIVLVHDGARPLIANDTIDTVISAARAHRAAIVAVPVKDTIKTVDDNGFVTATPDRKTLWAIQTPQAFAYETLCEAYSYAKQHGVLATDDAALVEQIGVKVKIVQGSYANFKITTPEDLSFAAALLGQGCDKMLRIGMGYDVHKLVEGRKLILGGVDIAHNFGLLGHSDADVLLHAIKDALLGAAALGDIGRHFPDSDEQYKGASSLLLLAKVDEILKTHGYRVNNIDATVVAEKPKLAPHIPTMNENIAKVLGVEPDRVNVKATTTEGLGFAGQKEGIAAYAVATIVKLCE